MKWRDRLSRHPTLCDIEAWPQLDPSLIQPAWRQAYTRNTRIVRAMLAGNTGQTVGQLEKVSKGRVSQLMNRCLGGDETQPPALRRGLVPHAIHPHSESDDGYREGCFRKLLRNVPGLKLGLDQLVLDRLKDRPFAGPLSPRRTHAEFKRLLANAGWPLDEYPYTTVDMAYESLRRYMAERWQLMCQAKKARRGAYRKASPDRSISRIFERIEIDEHTIDCQTLSFEIEVPLAESIPPMRLSRLTLLCAIDIVSDCVLGYYLAPTGHANHLDILSLLSLSLTASTPRKLTTTQLTIPSDTGFPNWFDDIQLPAPNEIALDNAWCHHSERVEEFVVESLLAHLSFGRPASPTVRRCIETVFARVNADLCHQLPSTTGSSVTDPKRESKKTRKTNPSSQSVSLRSCFATHWLRPMGVSALISVLHRHLKSFATNAPAFISLSWISKSVLNGHRF